MEVSGQLYFHGKSFQYPLNRRLGGPQSQYGCCGEKIFSLPGIEPQPYGT
jgi:hypothetical protein